MPSDSYQRPFVSTLISDLTKEKPLLRIIIGPRQVGKTFAAAQVARQWHGPVVRASADQPLPPGPEWLQYHWEQARQHHNEQTLLILDEVQKVKGWSETVKQLWDDDIFKGVTFKVILLGSSSLLLQKGLTESLAGRFFLYRCTHWTYPEMAECFGFSLDQWLYYGGYPGAADMAHDDQSWSMYVRDSLIETVLSKDIYTMANIAKPALMRHLFMLSCSIPASIVSFNKLVGQLQEAGNTTTIAEYLHILEQAFMISGLNKIHIHKQMKRASSPKLILWNNALINAIGTRTFKTTQNDRMWRGTLVENAVGAHLLNGLQGYPAELYYWRERNHEVDFAVKTPGDLFAIEVKSGKMKRPDGLKAFCTMHPHAKPLIIGGNGMELTEFFSRPAFEHFLM